jgi:TorA maturation chaperone TorD
MTGDTATVGLAPRLEPEDRLRADLYALFARLFVAAPDAELLRLIASAPLVDTTAPASPFTIAWSRLVAASSAMDAGAAADEYDALFGGIGIPEISLFASHYVGENAPGAGGSFLVALRAALARDGLARRTGQNMPEDHLAALLETMRMRIESGEPVGAQRAHFDAFIGGWYESCCTAIVASKVANYYVTVAECLSELLGIEKRSYEIA